MGRPPGPKKLAAIEQRDALLAKGMPKDEVRQALIEAGLTGAQANELLPRDLEPEKPKPVPTSDDKAAVLEGAINFLEGIAKRVKTEYIDRFPELGAVRNDALTWARKVKGAK
jgi:hypothetical protein